MNGDDWGKHFISRLLQLSHSQWLFRNVTLHDAIQGTLKITKRAEVLEEVERLSRVDPLEVAPESRFLLEMDFGSLYRSPVERQVYWVQAMSAAWKAGKRAAKVRARQGAGARRRAAKKRKPKAVFNTRRLDEQMQRELALRRPGKTRQVNVAAIEAQNPANKRLKKPD